MRKHSPSGIDLSGAWHAHAADPELVRTFAAPGSVNGSWQNVRVPHHWRAEPVFAESDGPVLYRKQFRGATTAYALFLKRSHQVP